MAWRGGALGRRSQGPPFKPPPKAVRAPHPNGIKRQDVVAATEPGSQLQRSPMPRLIAFPMGMRASELLGSSCIFGTSRFEAFADERDVRPQRVKRTVVSGWQRQSTRLQLEKVKFPV